MQLAMIGLGRMGLNMVRRLLQGGHDVVAEELEPSQEKGLFEGAMDPCTLVIIGASGDLTQRKLLPALRGGELGP